MFLNYFSRAKFRILLDIVNVRALNRVSELRAHYQMTGYAGSRDYIVNLQSPWRIQHLSTLSTAKQDSNPLVADSDPLVASSVHRTRNPVTRRTPSYTSLDRKIVFFKGFVLITVSNPV